MVSKDTYDFETKRLYRQAWAEFIAKHYPDRGRRKDLRVLCLPGHEGLEVTEVYLPMGFRPKNIWGVEREAEAFGQASGLNLGINLIHSELTDFLRSAPKDDYFDIVNFDFTGRASAFPTVMPLQALFGQRRFNSWNKTLLGTTFFAGRETKPEKRKLAWASMQYRSLYAFFREGKTPDDSKFQEEYRRLLKEVVKEDESKVEQEREGRETELSSMKGFLSSLMQKFGFGKREIEQVQEDAFSRINNGTDVPHAGSLAEVRDIGTTRLVLELAHYPREEWLRLASEMLGEDGLFRKEDFGSGEQAEFTAAISNSIRFMLRMMAMGLAGRAMFDGGMPDTIKSDEGVYYYARKSGAMLVSDIRRLQYMNDTGHRMLVDFFAFDPRRDWFDPKKGDMAAFEFFCIRRPGLIGRKCTDLDSIERMVRSQLDHPEILMAQMFGEFIRVSGSEKMAARHIRNFEAATKHAQRIGPELARMLAPDIPERTMLVAGNPLAGDGLSVPKALREPEGKRVPPGQQPLKKAI